MTYIYIYVVWRLRVNNEIFLLLKHVFYVSIKNIKTGSNSTSQNVVSTISTLHMHIDHVKTGTAKIFAPPPPLGSFVYINFDILQYRRSLQNKKPITFLTVSHV